MPTVSIVPEYSPLNYTNVAQIKIEKLASYTPYMIFITAQNQFGQLANIKTIYSTTTRGQFAVELTLKTTMISTPENVIKQIGYTLRMSVERLIVSHDPATEVKKHSYNMNEKPLLYRIIVTEDPKNEDITPAYEYGSKL